MVVLLTLIENGNNSLIGKDRNVCACKLDEEYFVELILLKIINNGYVHTDSAATINTEHKCSMHWEVVSTSCKIEIVVLSIQLTHNYEHYLQET